MWNDLRRVASIALVLLVVSLPTIAQTSKPSVEQIAWLAGCWEMKNDAKALLISEQWMKPAGGSMFGTGRTVKGGKTVDFEFTRIEQQDTGIFYIARPRENKEDTPFKLIKWGAAEVVFENAAHDFPDRVMYRLDGQHLFARIEGTRNGKLTGVDFPMNRVACN